jgi:hypothetical protein
MTREKKKKKKKKKKGRRRRRRTMIKIYYQTWRSNGNGCIDEAPPTIAIFIKML